MIAILMMLLGTALFSFSYFARNSQNRFICFAGVAIGLNLACWGLYLWKP